MYRPTPVSLREPPSPRRGLRPNKSQFIEVALGHTRPAHQKRVTPDGITRFWYECSYGTFGKGAPYRRFSASNLFRFHPHPYGMRLKPEGLSHGLKTVHRTVFTAACAAAALSSPARSIKKPDTRMGIWFFGTPEGTRTPNPRNRNPMLYPLSHRRIP